ncbi:uncharacterized protein LOC136079118 [Hydra vulgaris]|uniref:Uncharacterized protein LOC136079118 n=1 Tax=Hydra vulgaris TaxID=6087 RepID=A0ABM4BP67_HYDVU
MVRSRIRKTDREMIPPETMRAAVNEVLLKNRPNNQVAREFGVDRMTLKRYVKKQRLNPDITFKPRFNTRQVFTEEEEHSISNYLLQASKMNYGLSTKTTRQLAYEVAVANNKVCPDSWIKNKTAGIDWLQSFMKRKPELSLRAPEATSFARATAFNRFTVSELFRNLREVRERHHFGPKSIYNVDETGLTTVQKPVKVIASKGVKQVGSITSAESRTLVTACYAVNAIGNSIPPLFVFPRVKFRDFMIKDGPSGCVGFANPSGWMTSESFVEWLKHFIKHSHCSKESKVLLVLDNHESHLSVAALDLAREGLQNKVSSRLEIPRINQCALKRKRSSSF